MIKTFLCYLPFALFMTAGTASGQGLTPEAMNAITTSVRDICNAPDRKGSLLSMKGDVNADVGTFLKIADLEGTIALDKKEWDGLMDYLEDRPDYRDCAKTLTPMFINAVQVE